MRQGKVRYVGFSNWPAWMAAKAVGIQRARGWSQFRAAEMYYSLLGRDLEHEFVPLCADAGIGVMVWSPLAGGFLSGKYSRVEAQRRKRAIACRVRLPPLRSRARVRSDRPVAIDWRRSAARHRRRSRWRGCSRDRRCRRSSSAHRASTQLDENLKATDVKLDADDLTALDEATKPTRSVSALVQRHVSWTARSTKRSASRWRCGPCGDDPCQSPSLIVVRASCSLVRRVLRRVSDRRTTLSATRPTDRSASRATRARRMPQSRRRSARVARPGS